MAQNSFPAADSLNAEELAGNGVKVDTLKRLLPKITAEEKKGGGSKSSNPPKLISLDQVTVRGEDLTGMAAMPLKGSQDHIFIVQVSFSLSSPAVCLSHSPLTILARQPRYLVAIRSWEMVR
jgi:hypothetical protein